MAGSKSDVCVTLYPMETNLSANTLCQLVEEISRLFEVLNADTEKSDSDLSIYHGVTKPVTPPFSLGQYLFKKHLN